MGTVALNTTQKLLKRRGFPDHILGQETMLQGIQGESFSGSVAFDCHARDYHAKPGAIESLSWKGTRYK